MTDDRFDDESRAIRRRSAAVPPPLGGRPPAGAAGYVGRTYDGGAYPTAVPRVYLTHPVSAIDVDDAEGSVDSPTVDTGSTVPVLVLGSMVPPVGTDLDASRVGGYWVGEYGMMLATVGPGDIPGCPCQHIPDTLAMTSASSGCSFGTFNSDTLTWQARPAAYASLGTDDPGYYGSGTFLDGGGQSYQYFFTCDHSQFKLTRVYPAQGGNPAVLDLVRWSWPIGVSGNNCSPFSLTVGTVYAGGNPACDVTVIHSP